MSFQSFEFHPSIVAGIALAGYETPTPIQAESIPSVLLGRDVLGLAQTGTGKTAAFALPILQRLMNGPRKKVRTLVVAPTRELANQIGESFRTLGSQSGISTITLFGGVGFEGQRERLARGVEIVVACPGRLLDHLERRTISLANVETVVLDEADHMFDMGFLPMIRKILKALPARRQTLLFSATMPPEIRRLAMETLSNPVTVQVGIVAPASTVRHSGFDVDSGRKGDLLHSILKNEGVASALVFTRTKHRASSLARKLQEQGFKATSLQGNLTQVKREKAIEGFKSGAFTVMVATDIAARGIDISRVTHVINYDVPDTAEAYTHRIGRTGRAMRSGEAFTFISPDERSTVRAIERTLSITLPRKSFGGPALGESAERAPRVESARSSTRPELSRSGRSSQGRRSDGDAIRGGGGSGHRTGAPARRLDSAIGARSGRPAGRTPTGGGAPWRANRPGSER